MVPYEKCIFRSWHCMGILLQGQGLILRWNKYVSSALWRSRLGGMPAQVSNRTYVTSDTRCAGTKRHSISICVCSHIQDKLLFWSIRSEAGKFSNSIQCFGMRRCCCLERENILIKVFQKNTFSCHFWSTTLFNAPGLLRLTLPFMFGIPGTTMIDVSK